MMDNTKVCAVREVTADELRAELRSVMEHNFSLTKRVKDLEQCIVQMALIMTEPKERFRND